MPDSNFKKQCQDKTSLKQFVEKNKKFKIRLLNIYRSKYLLNETIAYVWREPKKVQFNGSNFSIDQSNLAGRLVELLLQ